MTSNSGIGYSIEHEKMLFITLIANNLHLNHFILYLYCLIQEAFSVLFIGLNKFLIRRRCLFEKYPK